MSSLLDQSRIDRIPDLETVKVPALPVSNAAAGASTSGTPAGEREASPKPKKAKSTSPRYDGLDAYRGITAIIIICYHCYQHAQGYGAYVYAGSIMEMLLVDIDDVVALFFVLSGFLNFLPFVKAGLKQKGPYPIGGFIVRRVIRIIPVYYLAFIVVWVTRFDGSPEQWLDLIEHLTFTQIFDTEHIFWTIGPAWSLAVEFWFYCLIIILAPITYWLSGRFQTQRARTLVLFAIPVVLFIFSFCYNVYGIAIAHIPHDEYAYYFSLPGRLSNLALGMGLAALVATRTTEDKVHRAIPWLIRGVAIACIVAVCMYREVTTNELLERILYPNTWGIAMVMIITAVVLDYGNAQPNKKSFSYRTSQYLGKISYSIFLWHEPLLFWIDDYVDFTSDLLFPLSTLALIVCTLAVASVSYRMLETPVGYLTYLFDKNGKFQKRYLD